MQVLDRSARQPLNLLVGSTGIKFQNDGGWQARKHGWPRRREWRKIHLAMNLGTGDVRSVEFPSNRRGDSPLLPDLLAQIPPKDAISTVTSDGPMIHDEAMAGLSVEQQTRAFRSSAMVVPVV